MKLSAPLRLAARLAAAAALALAALLSPGAASAAARHRAHHSAGPSFPMKADEYKALMEKRIDGVRAVIDKKLDRRGVSESRKKAIHKIFDEASRDLRAEIARAAADGTVTESEAGKVKPLLAGLRGKVRERLRSEKDPLAKGKPPKDEPAKKEKAKEPSAKPVHHDGAHHDGGAPDGADHDGKHATKTAGHTKDTKPAGAKPAKKKAPGPTKPAKVSPGKKRKPPVEADPGANL